MKKEDVIFAKKEFLNLPGHEEMASIMASIVHDDWNNAPDSPYRDITYKLIISDCTRPIHLEVGHNTKYDQENSLHKIDTLIETLTEFRKALVTEFKVQDEYEAKRKETEEKQKLEAVKDKEEVNDLKEQIDELTKEIEEHGV